MRQAIWFLIASLLGLLAVNAQAADRKGHIQSLRYHVDYTVQADGRFTKEVDEIVRTHTQEGVNGQSRYEVVHHRSLQSTEILLAETLKADGRKVAVAKAGIETQQGGLQGPGSRPDLVVERITFPELAVGDSIHVRYRLTQHTPIYPGHIAEWLPLNEGILLDDVRFSIDAPDDMRLAFEAPGLTPEPEQQESGRRTRVWTHRSLSPRAPENFEIDAAHLAPHLVFSNFATWQDLADAASKHFRPKAELTPRIDALAREIVGPASTPDEKARKLYDWVRSNIRYVATYIGAGGFEPHPAEWVLDNHYGDCKDHVVLLEALLRAQGIDSTPALINADYQNYRLSEVPNPYFSHVITYLPQLDRYLDATDRDMPFELLPEYDADKPVLLMHARKLARTPMPGQTANWLKRSSQVAIDADGSAERSTNVETRHLSAIFVRNLFRSIEPGKQNDWATKDLQQSGLRGRAILREEPSDDPSRALHTLAQHIENFIDEAEIGTLVPSSPFNQLLSVSDLLTARFESGERRVRPGLCAPVHFEEHIGFRFGAGLKPLRVPKNRLIEGEGLRLDLRYTQTGDTVSVESVFDWTPASYACTAAQFRAMAPIAKEILAASKRAIAYARDSAPE
jgi:hypothetical protein